MEKLTLSILFLLVTMNAVPQRVVARLRTYSPVRFDGSVGQISVLNTSAYPVEIALWHPDSGSTFATWTITAGSTKVLAH